MGTIVSHVHSGGKPVRFIIAFVFTFLAAAFDSHAYVMGGSNLGFTGYPKASCSKPFKPFSFTSQWDVDRYNNDLKRYADCVDEYMENANNDIKRIKESANDLMREVDSIR
ncbi:MAG: hypothetical protein EON60_01000 [Alphaproteobacteria bacterium]|nr:MAG: hypothetical protein EON60_01000 [Alphaproteobacteria bacterium]